MCTVFSSTTIVADKSCVNDDGLCEPTLMKPSEQQQQQQSQQQSVEVRRSAVTPITRHGVGGTTSVNSAGLLGSATAISAAVAAATYRPLQKPQYRSATTIY
jgi:hypothetical protein